MAYIQIMASVPNKKEAGKIADLLVSRRLAACVQVIGPVESTYRWKGKVEISGEWICFIKTKAPNYRKIEREIRKVHSYDVPEIISFKMAGGSSQYMKWLGKSLVP